MISKWRSGTGNQSYMLRYDQSSDRFVFEVSDTGSNTITATANNFGSPSTGTWYFLEGYHDATNDVIGVVVNRGTANTTSHTAGIYDSTASYSAGGRQGTFDELDGRLSGMTFYSAIPSDSIRNSLYNAGQGITYNEYVDDGNSTANLVSWWHMAETSGDPFRS